MFNIPFDHIKILPDGNFGCTLKLGKRIFCAICTPTWKVIEPLHQVETDPYSDYSYIRNDNSLTISKAYNDSQFETIKKAGIPRADDTYYIFKEYDFDIMLDDYLYPTSLDCEIENNSIVFFSVNYFDKEEKSILTLENSLAPYSVFGSASVKEIFNKYKHCMSNKALTAKHFDISPDTATPIQQEMLKIIDWAECINHIFARMKNDDFWLYVVFELTYERDFCSKYVKRAFKEQLYREICESELSLFPMMVYAEYIKQYVPEMCNSDTFMF